MSKTIHVQRVKELANSLLSNEKLSDDERKGIALFLEKMLFETNNYFGYGHVEWLNKGGYDKWIKAGQPLDDMMPYIGNQTMRIYY